MKIQLYGEVKVLSLGKTMSADSPRRGVHKGVQIVSPQPIIDRSIIDSVAGIINDIVPQAYVGTPNSENKETISWARFEYADINDPVLYPDYNEGSNTPPLLLVLGYTTGVQVWLIAATGEATEVLSWRQGVVRTLRILPNPKTDDEHADLFESKRPMVAVCDSAGSGPQFCSISFVSLKTGEQAKSIKFKNPVCDILANKRSIVVTFVEKIAVFDARTLEDVLSVTTCYASPGPNPNPVALGTRWLAYSEKKLIPAKRSSGGCEGDGVQSYTATVLYAAKSLGKGLRGLGETVASSLTGNSVSPVVINNMDSDMAQPGVITILDLQAAKEEKELDDANIETVIAHFTAHSDAIVAMTFDLSGALLMTADKRGHDFHVFRIQPHPGGPTLAAVHHLYILHRGDTTAKVQDMVFASDTRWAAISTVRGTTHVFPVAPYGGPVGVRTHSTPHVVNRLSRFHRSAGLMDDGTRSHSPVSHTELPLSVYPYSNPRLPPYPHPTVLHPLAQIRQPSSLNHVNSQPQQSRPQPRQRLHSDDSGTLPLKICACFAPPRAWMYAQRESTAKVMKRAVDSLFIMACHGNLIQYDLEPKPAAGVPREKICDDTMIELEVEAKGQWPLLRHPNSSEITPPLPTSSSLLSVNTVLKDTQDGDSVEDRWLSQVEIVTHAGPHRRLWMGPQFVFKTYNATSGAPVNLVEAEAVEIGLTGGSRPARSNPVNMPHAAARSLVPVVIDGSGSSYEQSPRFMEAYGDSLDSETTGAGGGENQLREDLAEAMLETSIAPHRAPGRRSVFERVGQPVTKVVNPLGTVITVSADEEDVDSSQEFETAEEIHVPEPPRSVCAEEGPASLGDLEPESQTLRDLTEICAEMRSASEPAIDSVPDENISEVKEKKSLCVEIARINDSRSSTIDFEKAEAFRDVPTGLRLCVEKGEIPNSPMTQAKEAAWCKKVDKREDKIVVPERNLSEAQYVVNCDEESVVLMENKLSHVKKTSTMQRVEGKKTSESEKISKKTGKSGGATVNSGKRVESKTPGKRYILKELEDGIVIEDPTCDDSKSHGRKRGVEKLETLKNKTMDGKNVESSKEANDGKFKCKSKSSIDQDGKGLKASFTTDDDDSTGKGAGSSVKSDLITGDVEKEEDGKSFADTDMATEEIGKDKSVLADSSNDFTSSNFHLVDAVSCNKDLTPVHSDEDIEHIQSSEIIQLQAECACSEKSVDVASCADSSPSMQRKNSKNTISDDDLEYIHTSELVDPSDKSSSKDDDMKLDIDKNSDRSKCASSDDDIEHVQAADICNATIEETKEAREDGIKKFQDVSPEQVLKVKNSKKTKDIFVIEGDTSPADVTVIFKPGDSSKSKNAEKKNDLEDVICTKDMAAGESSSPLKRSKNRLSKTSLNVTPKRSQTGIEIIDIDAMQKAEMEVLTEASSAPECKILSTPEVCATRSKKSRKNKKSNVESSVARIAESSTEATKVEEEFSKDIGQEPSDVSWSTVLKKKSMSPVAESEIRKEAETEEFVEPVKEYARSPLLEKIESLKKKIRNTSSRQSFETKGSCSREKLWETVSDRDTETSSDEVAKVSWSSIVRKKHGLSTEQESKKDLDVDSIAEESEPKEAKNRRKSGESSVRSLTKIDQPEETLSRTASEDVPVRGSETFWSFIVKRKLAPRLDSSTEAIDDKIVENVEPEDAASGLEIQSSPNESFDSVIEPFDESVSSKASKKQISSEIVESDSRETKSFDRLVDDATFAKEGSLEPERDVEPEKKSDSEQEIVPERSSSSDEFGGNLMFGNVEGEYGNRETIGKNVTDGSTTVACSASKKGNRSKKKKRR